MGDAKIWLAVVRVLLKQPVAAPVKKPPPPMIAPPPPIHDTGDDADAPVSWSEAAVVKIAKTRAVEMNLLGDDDDDDDQEVPDQISETNTSCIKVVEEEEVVTHIIQTAS